MHTLLLGVVALGLASCAATEVPAPLPPGHATPPVPPPTSTAPVAQTPVSSEAREIAAAAKEGWHDPMFARDERGLVDGIQFARMERVAFVRNDKGIDHIKTFVAGHGQLFGYGVLGEPSNTLLVSDGDGAWLASVTYPRAERCPNLEIGLLYSNMDRDDDGRPLGMPLIWVAHCPRADNDTQSVGDHLRPRGHWATATRVAQMTAGDPFVAWLCARGYPLPTHYEKAAGKIRIQFDGKPPTTSEHLPFARALLETVVKLEHLPPLERETVKKEPGKGKSAPIVEVSFSPKASAPANPTVRFSFELRERYVQALTKIEIDLE